MQGMLQLPYNLTKNDKEKVGPGELKRRHNIPRRHHDIHVVQKFC